VKAQGGAMGRRSRTVGAAITAAVLGMSIAASGASASFHEMKIRAFFKGPTDTSYVELQMYAAGQNFTNTHTLSYYDHTGTLVSSSPPMTDVGFGDNQRTILIADTGAAVTPDFTWATLFQNINSDATGGAICYENIDCFAWGAWTAIDLAKLPSPVSSPIGLNA